MNQLPIYQVNSNQFSVLKFLSSAIALSPTMVWALVAFIGIVFIIFSMILSYHWRRFSIDKLVMAQASLLYFSVSSALFVIMIVSLTVYLNSL